MVVVVKKCTINAYLKKGGKTKCCGSKNLSHPRLKITTANPLLACSNNFTRFVTVTTPDFSLSELSLERCSTSTGGCEALHIHQMSTAAATVPATAKARPGHGKGRNVERPWVTFTSYINGGRKIKPYDASQ